MENRLVSTRLGVYTGLFYALRAKHPPTAAHALRVAIGCSKWFSWRRLADTDRDLLEVAALMHDVGKIGVPDRILQKPARLEERELLMMDMQHGIAEEMLRGAGGSNELINIVRLARTRYDIAGRDMPVAAQVLAIVDAFDSMTTEQVFRRALSRERAFEELFANAGSQFNPVLVRDFVELVSQPRPELEAAMAHRWLFKLAPNMTPGFLESDIPPSCGAIQNMLDTLFHHRLLDRLKDAAVYLDADHQILNWNRAAEQLTGRRATAVLNRQWTADLMQLRSADGQPLSKCPLRHMTSTGSQVHVRFQVCPEGKEAKMVNFMALPVFTGKKFAGSIILLRDASNEADLEQRVQSLHQIATQDTLTKVANRAELNRRLPEMFRQYEEDGIPGSLIICDIDFFKKINDTYGHQAGDQALVSFAGVLRENAREGDLVARYGGEEFVVLCTGCDNPAATSRAEQMRRAVAKTPMPALKKRALTASFGVTEIQAGDDVDTLIARADRALLTAKQSGRNCVIQLGAGRDAPKTKAMTQPFKRPGWMGWFRGAGEPLISAEYLAAVPKAVAIQKLRGFISDHQAELTSSVDESRVVIRVDGKSRAEKLRGGERPAVMLLDVFIQDVQLCCTDQQQTYQKRTMFVVAVRPLRARDRRSDFLRGQAQRLLQSFQAYLVAQEIDDDLRQLIIEPR